MFVLHTEGLQDHYFEATAVAHLQWTGHQMILSLHVLGNVPSLPPLTQTANCSDFSSLASSARMA